MEPAITLLGCGDVGPIHEPVDAFCSLVQPSWRKRTCASDRIAPKAAR